MNKDDVFYDLDDAEELRYDEKDEAIEMIIDKMISPVPLTFKLYTWKRTKVVIDIKKESESILESLIETLDETYGGPDEPSDITDEMHKATEEYLKKIQELYVPWACEKTGFEVINTKEWVQKNAPHWIKEGLTFKED